MYIQSGNFPHRQVLNARRESQYSPKKRWDENSFGADRQKLSDFVSQSIMAHQNDDQVLQRFRKQAEAAKEKKRRQKFPHLYLQMKKGPAQEGRQQKQPKQPVNLNFNPETEESYSAENTLLTPIVDRKKMPEQYTQRQPLPASFENNRNFYELEARIQYERLLSQKELELYKRDERIKKQQRQIRKLHRRLRENCDKQEELQKMVKQQTEIKNLKKELGQLNQDVERNQSLIRSRLFADNRQEIPSPSLSYSPTYHPTQFGISRKKNQSQLLFTNNFQVLENPKAKTKQIQTELQVEYSPKIVTRKHSKSNAALLSSGMHALEDNILSLKNERRRLDLV